MNIKIENLKFAYNGKLALDQIDLDVGPGEILSLVGPNGSGKSTLLKAISGVLTPKAGVVLLDGQSIAELKVIEIAKKIASLEQDHHVGFDFSVRELIEWGRTPHRSRLARWSDADEAAVAKAIDITGLDLFQSKSIHEISGGEKQRVFLAMAIAQEPQVLLLDEPTAHLDLKYQLDVLKLLRQLSRMGMSIVMAVHDLNLAADISHRICVLNNGLFVACGSPGDVVTHELIDLVWGVKASVKQENGVLRVIPSGLDEQ